MLEDVRNNLIEKARNKALYSVDRWREECEKQGWNLDQFLKDRAPAMARSLLVKTLIESGQELETLGDISAFLEYGENRILASIFGSREPLEGYLTVGELKQILERLPDCTPVFYERLEDKYFERYHWKTVAIRSADPICGDMQCVPTFTASIGTDEEGRKVLALTAHY